MNNRTEIIGIAGGNKTGKSTFSSVLRAQAESSSDLEYSDPIIKLTNHWLDQMPQFGAGMKSLQLRHTANAWIINLPASVEEILGEKVDHSPLLIRENQNLGLHIKIVDYLESYHTLERPITRENKYEHVSILQWLGANLSQTLFSNYLGVKSDQAKANGHDLITIGGARFQENFDFIRKLGGFMVKVRRPEVETQHEYVTETTVQSLQTEVEVFNDGTLEQLGKAAVALWQVVRENREDLLESDVVINAKEY